MRTLALIGAAALLAGCAAGPNYEKPDLKVPEQYRGADASATGAFADLGWWEVMHAPALQALIRDALAHNPDLATAAARVDEAEATLRSTHLQYLPTLDATAGVERAAASRRELSPGRQRIATEATAGVGVSYELDLWGRVRRLNEAARAQWLAQGYNRDAVAASLVSSVATAYFNLTALDEQLAALKETEDAAQRFVDLTHVRRVNGAASALDELTAQSELAATRASRADVERQQAQTENLLSTLAGRYPQGVERAPPDDAILVHASQPPAGLPAQLLERRPDLRAAEQDLRSANALIGAQKAALLPTISLTGMLGLASPELATLAGGDSSAWSFGGSILMPLLDPQRNLALVDAAEARQRAAAGQYRAAALTAMREVADALTERSKQGEILAQRQQQVDALKQARDIAMERYRVGYSSYFEVITAEQNLSAAQLQLAAARRGLQAALVQLYLALGGGWQPEPAAQP